MSSDVPHGHTQESPSLLAVSGWTNWHGRIRGILLIAATAVIFALLFRRIDLTAVGRSLAGIPPRAWLSALLLTVTFPILSALRWRLTLRALGYRVSFSRCLTIILGVSPVSAIAPSKAGDLLKAISFRGQLSTLEVAGSVLTERALDIILLSAFSFLGGFFIRQGLITRASAFVAASGLVALLLLPSAVASIRRPGLRGKLERVVRILGALRSQPALLLAVVALTTLNWLASIVQTHVLLTAVGAGVPFLATVAVLPMAIFIGLVPITIGGMGTRDAALVTLLAPWASAPQALTVGLLYSFFGYWLLAVLGLPFLRAALFPRWPLPATDHAQLSSG